MMVAKRFCQRCNVEIPAERLEVLPDTVICVSCSREIGSEYEVQAVPVNLAKSGSLKRNYGSFSVRKRRREILPR